MTGSNGGEVSRNSLQLNAAVLGQVCLSDLAGHIKELFAAYSDTSLHVGCFDIKDDATHDVNPGVAGSVDIGADPEQI